MTTSSDAPSASTSTQSRLKSTCVHSPLRANRKASQEQSATSAWQVSADTDTTRVDEPIMLSLKLSGRGNFDRIKGPEMKKTRGWRNYKPESDFRSKRLTITQRRETFRLCLHPREGRHTQTPRSALLILRPESRRNTSSSVSPAISVEVAPSTSPCTPDTTNRDRRERRNTSSQSHQSTQPRRAAHSHSTTARAQDATSRSTSARVHSALRPQRQLAYSHSLQLAFVIYQPKTPASECRLRSSA